MTEGCICCINVGKDMTPKRDQPLNAQEKQQPLWNFIIFAMRCSHKVVFEVHVQNFKHTLFYECRLNWNKLVAEKTGPNFRVGEHV